MLCPKSKALVTRNTHPFGQVDFLNYPDSKGWSVDLAGYSESRILGSYTHQGANSSKTGRPQDERNEVFQTWAFFGLMSENLQRPVPKASFSSLGDDGEEYINIETLP